MSDSNKKTTRKTLTPNAALVKIFAGILAGTELTAVLFFGATGRLDWPLGWLFVAAWCLLKLVFIILLRWHDLDWMVKRATRHENTQRYDRLIVPIDFVFTFGTIFVAGLDGGRFRWSGDLPWP